MTYYLSNDGRGYLRTRETLFYDTEGEISVSVEGAEGQLFASVYTDKRKVYVPIKEGAFVLPRSMLTDGVIHIVVSEITDGEVVRLWTLEDLRAVSLTSKLEPLCLVEPQRIYRAEEKLVEFVAELDGVKAQFAEQKEELASARKELSQAVERYNAAAAVINGLSERLTALEANYDPTVIE